MDFSSGGGGGGGSGGRKKRYHRHTAHQIQRLEAIFKECPHPDEKTRLQLSRELNLHPRQIKFWFQNRRTQMKAQHERADNSALRSENDKIRCENIAIRQALKNVICPSCGGPPVTEDLYFDEQKLRIENVQLKEELDRVSSIAAKYIGRPISQLSPVQPIHVSSLDLTMASFSGHGMLPGPGQSLDLHLLPGSSTNISNLPFPTMSISDMDKSLMADVAGNAMDELIRLLQTNEPLWMKSSNDGREILNLENYKRIFPRQDHQLKNPNIRIEASRDSGVVIMNGLALVDMFMDVNKWIELFPTIVSRARSVEILSPGMLGSQSGALQLMYEELQVLSPLVPTRQFYFLRFCQQIEEGTWTIVDISYDLPHQENQFASSCKVHRLLSGCLIQDMPNGYSKVTWVEYWEVEDKAPIHRLFMDLIHSGLAFGAEKWLLSLQRICERYACLMVTSNSSHDLLGGHIPTGKGWVSTNAGSIEVGDLNLHVFEFAKHFVSQVGVIPSPEGKRSMMKLAQRMVNNFCASLNPSDGQQWSKLSGSNEFEVRATLHKSTDPGQPNAMVLSAASTLWLPIPPENAFSFFRDERNRPQWDVLSNQNLVEEVAHIANGSHPGNCISVIRALNTSQSNMLILQESCIDSSGSLIVYCPVDLHHINIAMSGEDPSYIPLLPSGLTISPDGRPDQERGAVGVASTSSNNGAGSLVTVVFQILVSNLPSAKMSPESVTTINNLISNTVHQIKAALNCTTSG